MEYLTIWVENEIPTLIQAIERSVIIPGMAVAFERVPQEPKFVKSSPAQRPDNVLAPSVAVFVVLWRLQGDGPQVGVLEVERLQLGHAGKRLRRQD